MNILFKFLIKDLLVIKNQILIGLAVALASQIIIGFSGIENPETSLLLYYIPFVIGTVVLTRNFQTEDKSNSLQFLMVMPIERWRIVLSKYILILVTIVGSFIMMFVVNILLNLFSLNVITFSFSNVSLPLSIAMFYFSIYIYLYFRFGVSYVQFSSVVAFLFVIGLYKINQMITISLSLNILLPIISVIAIFLFYYVSLRALKKRFGM